MSSWKNPSVSSDLLDYPPLYSVQVAENRNAQYRVWADIITAHAMKTKTWLISLQGCPIFTRSSIQKEAPLELRQGIIEFMKENGRALWFGSSQKSQAYILRKSMSDWIELICTCLRNNGVTNPFQAHELIEEIEYEDEPFATMPEDLMELILQQAARDGKLRQFKVDGVTNYKIAI